MNLAGTRASARIAWRDARRAPWRSALIALLVALPIAGLTGSTIVIRTSKQRGADRQRAAMGSADLRLDVGRRANAGRLLADLPPGAELSPIRESLGSEYVVGATIFTLHLFESGVPIDRAPVRGELAIVDGRVPVRPGEAALPPKLLELLHGAIGASVQLPGGRSVLVTGTVVQPEALQEWTLVVLAPGTLPPTLAPTGYLVTLPPGSAPESAGRLESVPGVEGVTTRLQASYAPPSTSSATATAIAFAVTSVVLFGAGLIVAAAFVVGTRRRLRTLGLIGATGGSRRHVLAAVLFGGVLLGAIGSLLGIAAAIVAALVAHGWLDRLAGRLTGRLDVPLLPLAGAVALGTAAATLAAWWPARMAARLTTMEALDGRTPVPRRPGKAAAAGLVVVVAGSIVLASGVTSSSYGMIVAGLLLTACGFLFAIPLVVVVVGVLAAHLPLVTRLAGRDLARSARRTGAALAAAAIALSIPVAVGATALSQEGLEQQTPYLAPDQLIVSFLTSPNEGAALKQEQRAADRLRSAFPGWTVEPAAMALFPADPRHPRSRDVSRRVAIVLGPTISEPGGANYVPRQPLTVGGPDVLRIFHAEAGIPALLAGKVVAIGPASLTADSLALTRGQGGDGHPVARIPAVEAGPARYGSLGFGEPTYVVSPQTAARLGLGTSRLAWFRQLMARAPGPLTDEEIARARRVLSADPSAYAQTERDFGTHSEDVRRTVDLAGGMLALSIVGVVVALVSAETRRGQAILVAVGAGPSMRRRLEGTSAWLLALVAGIIAVPAGWVPVAVVQSALKNGYPIVPPWSAIATAVVGVPLVAGLVAAGLSREPKAARLLRPLV